MIDDQALEKILNLGTREEQRAFLEGLRYAASREQKQPEPPVAAHATTAAEVSAPGRVLKPSLGVTLSFQRQEDAHKRHQPNRGLGADMLRMLWTGPISIREFYDQLTPRYERSAISKSVRDLVRKGLAAESKDSLGLYVITVPGRSQAQYFVHHNAAKSVCMKTCNETGDSGVTR